MRIPLTVGGVTDWVRERDQDRLSRRYPVAIDTTPFSVLQSLLDDQPDRWGDVVDRLTFGPAAPAG